MSRATRLLTLLEHMRSRRRPVTAAELARDLGTSLRTVYRDIATLQGQGAAIEGEAGLGYVLREGYFLPPLNFTADEADALLLGLALVQGRGGGDLAAAARLARGKIEAVLPAPAIQAGEPAIGVVLVGRGPSQVIDTLRTAIRDEQKVRLSYRDAKGQDSLRTVWPLLIGLFESTETLAAWCETRDDYRHFRLDRIVALETIAERMPRRRQLLLAEWRMREGIDARH
jgi:predicted DNA-binding transcriptional regulator YafY